MTDIYNRLREVGFPKSYVQNLILPDWWEDQLAADPGNRRLAELAISRTLRIPLAELVDRHASLSLMGESEVRFKRWQDVERASLLPAVVLAKRVCELVLSYSMKLPEFQIEGHGATELRERILYRNQYITLPLLLKYSWDLGVPIVHLQELPEGLKRVDGMAFLVKGRPCIALASSRRSPAWLIWHLAHELGHVANGHLKTADALDVSIEMESEHAEEKEANLFALDLVYGAANRAGFDSERHLTGEALAKSAKDLGPIHGIHPGCIATNYGFNMKAWGTANKALGILGMSEGGPQTIRTAVSEHVDLEAMPETDQHFFSSITGMAGVE